MQRTQIFLNPEQKEFLESMAFILSRKANKRVSVSEVIRKAVDNYRLEHEDIKTETELILQSPHLMEGLKNAMGEEEFLEYNDVFG
jgi:hypothetical protein